jgi:hypothetical protein
MEWIRSGGGPLICVERGLVHLWRGVMGTEQSAAAEGPVLSDYGRACEVVDYLGVIDLGPGRALVLGGEPMTASVWKDPLGHAVIVRVRWQDPERDVGLALGELDASCFDEPDEAVNMPVKSGYIEMFDSAYPGSYRGRMALLLTCAPGTYRILTKSVDPDSRLSMVLHKFVAVM